MIRSTIAIERGRLPDLRRRLKVKPDFNKLQPANRVVFGISFAVLMGWGFYKYSRVLRRCRQCLPHPGGKNLVKTPASCHCGE